MFGRKSDEAKPVKRIEPVDLEGSPTANGDADGRTARRKARRITLGRYGMWSDVALKERIVPVVPAEVLAKVTELRVSTWSYRWDDGTVTHMGPMAQDFAAAFTLGDDDRMISPIDESGVALAAIQGLYQLAVDQARRIEALEARLAD